MRHWQAMCTISKWKLRSVIWCRFLILLNKSWSLEVFSGTVHWFCSKTSFHPLLWTSSGLKGSWKLSAYIRFGSLRSVKSVKTLVCDAHNITTKVYKRTSQTLLEVRKLVEKLNTAQQVTATLSLNMVNMMLNENRCFVCSKTGHIGHHCPSVQWYNCDSFGHFTQHCPEKVPSSGTPHHHYRSLSHSHYDYNYRDRLQSFHPRCNQGSHLTGQDNTIDLNVTEALATTGGTHSTTTTTHNTHSLTVTLGDTPARTPHTITATMHLWCDALPEPLS